MPELGDAELERVARRWHQLPLDRALLAYPGVRDVVQLLADDIARETGKARVPVPDLGPAVAMDQLRVMVHDWRRAGLPEGDLGGRLIALRRKLP
ncbi:hypothetical protein [Ornithinimicrobium pratense]|uniref:Uncharacterized protein n=1 Tax=Ornithinimicrobium pratense TaxID=2593973 RepID=A0A5J6V371_9MICO|nr:hypothetical protein [Ornithinimicrobium pratense]QFG67764.1 hypothetical protein FY030_02605 [Ornithinimicrobium pratense]